MNKQIRKAIIYGYFAKEVIINSVICFLLIINPFGIATYISQCVNYILTLLQNARIDWQDNL